MRSAISNVCYLATLLVLLCIRGGAAFAADPISAEDRELFEGRIRPVLIEHCYECHNSVESAEGELALDYRAGLLQGGTSGPAIVPGKPGESLLIKVIRHEIDDLKMPEGGPKLEASAIADLEKWIALGAPDPRDNPPTADELAEANEWKTVFQRRKKWWSFQPLRRASLPDAQGESWSNHPVDRFVLAKLEASGLAPGKPADAPTVVRRLYFALVGLPPTSEEAEYWTTQLSPDGNGTPNSAAVEELVDHLLASPHFGERWARHWMDWIRYAESHGSEGDPPIEGAWRYRDYLIRALNADVPYDQLVREHVAGDLLRSPRVNLELGINESIIGTAHWRMVFHGFAPTDALEEKVRFTDDQINAFSKAFLGLTVSCARCHDHKFDPISQQDYYALFGILGSCRPGRTAIDLPERLSLNRGQLASLKPRIRKALAADWLASTGDLVERLMRDDGPWTQADKPTMLLHTLFSMHSEVSKTTDFATAWESQVKDWKNDVATRTRYHERDTARRWNLADGESYSQWFAHGAGLAEKPSPAGEFALESGGDKALVGIYPAGVYSHGLSSKHEARLTSPDVHLDDQYDLYVHALGQGGATARYVVQNYPRNGTVYPITNLPGRWTWQKYDLAYWNGDDIHVELATAKDAPLQVKDNPRSWFGIREAVLVKKGQAVPSSASREFLDPLFAVWEPKPGADPAAGDAPEDFHQLAEGYVRAIETAVKAWRDGTMTDAQAVFLNASLQQGLLPNALDLLPTAKPLVEAYRKLEAEIPVPTRVPSLDESLAHNQRLFTRGNHKTPAEEVPRRFLELVDATAYQTTESGRRQLAEDLLRPDNPLTRRVIVNRVWHHLFGHGLVRTPDNLGRLGAPPTHPELLDYLAARFSDPPNNEATQNSSDGFGWSLKNLIRHIVTSKTWLLSSQTSDKALQMDPDNRLLSHAGVRRLEAEAIRDSLLAVSGQLSPEVFGKPVSGKAPRRSIYVQVRRNSLDPFLRVFDFPEPFTTVGRRDATNVPAQSLTLMNDPAVEDYAMAWANQVLADDQLTTDEARLKHMFLTAFGRAATADEIADATGYLNELHGQYERLAAAAVALGKQISTHDAAIRQMIEPARKRLLEDARSNRDTESLPRPIARWKFDDDLRDTIGNAHASASGNARLDDGSLVVDGKLAHAVTAPLGQALGEKTLEAWVQLDDLQQRGGGVMSVQTPDGVVFDAIVFGEKEPGQWLAGSNNFVRTRSFQAPSERDARDRAVHVAIAYHADGRIVGYRDGQRYGTAYKGGGPVEFAAGNTIVTFGVRHLPATGNRMLAGRILQAQLYDRALSDEEILATSKSVGRFVAEADVVAALSAKQRAQVERHQAAVKTLQSKLQALGPVPSRISKQVLWKDLARAMFCFKKFIYIR